MKFSKLFKFWGNDIIEFYCHPDLKGIIPEPRPAVKYLPDWFKDLSPVCDEPDEERDMFGNRNMTAKKCLPLLDAMSLGYTIPLAADLHIRSNHNNTQIAVTNPPGMKLCEFHSSVQLGGQHKLGIKHGDALKFINPWIIKTAPGWSTLFTSPFNHFDQPFTCLTGFVDTDVYPKEVNFPAILKMYDADVNIPAGTPLVTVIPVKRNSFPRKPNVRDMSKEDFDRVSKIQKIQNLQTHYYTYKLRKRD